MKISIVIPTMTYNLVKECVDSLIKNTNLDDIEIIVVANGADPKLKDLISDYISNDIPIKLIWYDIPLGAVIALNAGIMEAKGEYVLLFNDDCQILPYRDKDFWLESLLEPFSNPKMACTGPCKLTPILGEAGELQFSAEDSEYGFIIFFCALIPRRIFDEIGLLDEELKCGVDIDFCMKLKRAGYLIEQVPNEECLGKLPDLSKFVGDYPIYHKAEGTVHDYYGMEEWIKITKEDAKILEKRYSIVKQKKISIVIPTTNRELAFACLNSIILYTDLDDIEIIVVANGADKELQVDISNLPIPIKLIWFDNPIGSVPAFNVGIKAATGEYSLLLNDDCELLPYKKNYWIEELLAPFSDPKMACTGPFKMDSDISPDTNIVNREFILFFCALIPNRLFKEFGYFDEKLRCNIDVDFCLKVQLAGYKIKQIPTNKLIWDEKNSKQYLGDFPLFHEGAATVYKKYGFKEWQEIITEDKKTLNEKYLNSLKVLETKIETEMDKFLDEKSKVVKTESEYPNGFFGPWDIAMYREMIKSLPDNGYLVEIGVLIGRSLCSIADLIIQKNLHVTAVDLFEDFYEPIFDAHFPHQLEDFISNLKKFNIYDRVEIKKGRSDEISKLFKHSCLDMIFIDGDHSYEGVKTDFLSWYSKVKPGGIIAGHDIEWDSVKAALDEVIGLDILKTEFNLICSYNIWYMNKPKVYDGFMFFNELDVLEIRLNEMYDVVTKFIIVEGARKHSGEINDQMYLFNNLHRFDKFRDKIIYLKIEDYPPMNNPHDPWDYERHLRDCIRRGWEGVEETDVIMVSDCDEIPRASAVANYRIKDGLCHLVQNLYYYYLNNYVEPWIWGKILPYGIAKVMSPCAIRYTHTFNKIKNAGWHFSFMGGKEKIIEKFTSYAHQEYNSPKYLDRISESLETGEDILRRPELSNTIVQIDDSYPKFVIDNIEEFKKKDFLKIKIEPKKIIDVTWPIIQKKYEMIMLQEFLKDFRTEKILEIGSFRGGTTMLWAQMVAPYNGMVYTVDLEFELGGFIFADGSYYRRQVYNDSPYEKFVTEIAGNSHALEVIEKVKKQAGMVDLLFIDGDHSYEGVKRDFENYFPLVKKGGYVVFHDITDTIVHRSQGVFVSQLWNGIKNKYESWEFIDNNIYTGMLAHCMGVGVLRKD